MKKMDKETLLAGLVGIIALVAIICEVAFGGISTVSVSAAIKDLTGIAIDVTVFLLAFKIATKKKDEEPLEKKLENALDEWRIAHSNMIIRDEEYDKKIDFYSLFMRVDLKNFFGDAKASKLIGWFVRIPKLDSPQYKENTFDIHFHLNVSTFLDGKIVEDRKRAFEYIADDISKYLQAKCSVTIDKILFSDDGAKITVKVNGLTADDENGISVDDRIKDFISIIDTAYMSYLVAGNFKVKQ